MVALVTGAAGFLGRYACKQLVEDGWRVVGAGRPETEIPSPEFDRQLERVQPELVVHCAGPSSVPDSVRDPKRDFEGAVSVLATLLERLASSRRKPRVVLLSSAAVYGQPTHLPVSEDDPVRPMSPYGFHRAACELLLREFHEIYGLPGISLRVFSAYGEGLKRQILWDICTRAIVDGGVQLDGSGQESRDFVHGRDVAQAISAAARRAAFEGEVYNVGTGVETTIRELADTLVAALGVDAEVTFSGRSRRGDPANWRADIARLDALGVHPSVRIQEGVRSYADWARRALQSL